MKNSPLLERVKRWDSTWQRDYWWRQRHRVAFNSAAHRELTPLDVAFEYVEQALVEEQRRDMELEETRKKELKKYGLFSPRTNDELWDKINWDSFK